MRRTPALLLCTLIGIAAVSAQEMRVYTEGENNFAPSMTRFELTTETDREIAEIRYRINGGESMVYEEPLQFAEEGRYQIVYASVDTDGVRSQEETYSVVIDDTAPAITATARGPAMVAEDTTYLRSDTELHLQASDSASGVAHIFVSLDNENFQEFSGPVSPPEEGRYRGYAYAVDNVGNRSPTVTLAAVVDDTAPTARIIPRQPMATVRGTRFVTTGSTFAIHAEDTGSGISRVEVSVDDGEFVEFTAAVPFDEPGAHTLRARAIDRAGNMSTVAQLSFVVDEALPQPSVDTLLD